MALNSDPLAIKIIVKGPPVPYVRMTKGTIWTDRSVNYLGYQRQVAKEIQDAYPDRVLEIPVKGTKEYKAFIKEQKLISYCLSANVYAENDRGDLDNYIKTIEDAIQRSGVIWNDKQVKEFSSCELFVDKENPRIEFTLVERHWLAQERKVG